MKLTDAALNPDKRTRRTCKCGAVSYPKIRSIDVTEPWVCEPCNDRQILRDNGV